MNYVVATVKPWDKENFEKIKTDSWHLLDENWYDWLPIYLAEIKPRYIFFTHWSWRIPPEIYNNYECVVFHPADLPEGRGSSLIQHRIQSGIYHTKVSAIKVNEGFDTGDIYMKRDLCLNGGGEEIYLRLSETIFDMIKYIVENEPVPVPQCSKGNFFKHRTPEQSRIGEQKNIKELHDFIRMLDAETYPNAFVDVGKFRLTFSRPCLKIGRIIADVEINENGRTYDTT